MPLNNPSIRTAWLLAGVWCAFLATPASPQQVRQPEKSINFELECDPASLCSQSTPAAEKKVLATLDAVKAWFDSMGYPPTRLPQPFKSLPKITITDQWGCTSASNRGTGTPSALACVSYDPRSGMPRQFRVPLPVMTGSPLTLEETLAHESTHTLVIGNTANSRVRWLNEAVAEAIGFQWLARQGLSAFPKIHPTFEMDLDLPFYEGTQEGYEKAPYFALMVNRITAPLPDNFGHLRGLFANWPDEKASSTIHPMAMLYGSPWIPGEASFAKVFPEFVARYNNPTEQIGGTGRYYETVENVTLPKPVTVGTPYDVKFAVPVQPFAAKAAILKPSSINAGKAVKDADRLAAVTHEIVKAPQIADLSLIFEHEVARNRRHSYLTFLHPGYLTDYGFIRIANAGSAAAKTSSQKAELNLRVDPVSFPIPACIGLKGSTTFKMTGASPSDIGNFRLEASAGRFDGMTYYPPSTAQVVTFKLVIESPITRAQLGIDPVNRPNHKVELGKQKISNTACSVRMYLDNGRNERVVATQDLVRQFTEFKTPDGSALYARRDEIIAKSKGKWSDPLPSSFLDMVFGNMPMGALGSLEGLLKNMPSAAGGGLFGHFASMPTTVTQTFQRETVATLLGNKNMRPSAVSCPDGTGQCEGFSGVSQNHQLTAIYNTQRQLMLLSMDNAKMTFEYNVPTDDIPPSWNTAPDPANIPEDSGLTS